ncbi:alpha-E domain-containing protein, partial [Klebsiella pneumoniae]|uniref:alpha-E domain-containing protein n=1 Tax=Klebsiella pneumoniae TaxID=573 RepID=UPI001D0F39B5
MLSRTASDLYWMSRYLERAENLARMLEVSYSLSLMPQAGRSDGHSELAMSLLASGTLYDNNTANTELYTRCLVVKLQDALRMFINQTGNDTGIAGQTDA